MSTDPNAAILAALADMEGRISERIDAIDARQRGDTASLRGDVATLREDVASLHEGTASLREDVTALRGDVAASRADTAALAREIIAATDAAVAASEERLRSHLDMRVTELAARQAEFKHETREAIDDMELAVSSVQRDAARRHARLDDRLRAIEHPEEAKR